jgi:hypothetical protein
MDPRALWRRLRALLRRMGRLHAPGSWIGELDSRMVRDVGLEVWRGGLGVRVEIDRRGLERINSLI